MHLNLLSRRLLPASLALILGTAAPLAAHAIGVESIPWSTGASCVAGKTENTRISYGTTGVQNDSTSTAKVWCPMVYFKPDAANFNGGHMYEIDFEVVDQNAGSGKDVKCTLYGMDEITGDVGFTQTQSSFGASSGTQYLWFSESGDPELYKMLNGMSYVASCLLPPVSNGKTSRVRRYGQNLPSD
jgi:hypothetical protein